jgi:hypothetical protein
MQISKRLLAGAAFYGNNMKLYEVETWSHTRRIVL